MMKLSYLYHSLLRYFCCVSLVFYFDNQITVCRMILSVPLLQGSAEVVYTRRSDAFAALKRYNNVLLDGKPMKIEVVGANAEMPVARVNVAGLNGRKKRTVVMTYVFYLSILALVDINSLCKYLHLLVEVITSALFVIFFFFFFKTCLAVIF